MRCTACLPGRLGKLSLGLPILVEQRESIVYEMNLIIYSLVKFNFNPVGLSLCSYKKEAQV